jgi:copper homeostasis protein
MGVSLLSELVALAKTRIIIMPGAGINSGNVQRILEQTKAREIHLSASKLIDSRMIYHKSSLKLHSDNLTQYSVRQPDINEIIMIKKLMV